MGEWIAFPVAIAAAFLSARVVSEFAIRKVPRGLLRTNVDGREVPAVLGIGIVVGTVVAIVCFQIFTTVYYGPADCGGPGVCLVLDVPPWRQAWVALIPSAGMFLAGLWDDLQGDERPRGFSGHLGAVRGGAVTGGIVKMVAGMVVGIATISALDGWNFFNPLDLILMAAPVALGANLLNLFDRAPGRALKVFAILSFVTVAVFPPWRFLAAGPIGAAVGVFGIDLKARGMLGDSGANPIGAIAALGLVVLMLRWGGPFDGRLSLLGLNLVLLSLNLVSEKVSFSKVIEETPWLARLDHLGRR